MSPPFPGSVGGVVAVWDADDLSLSDGDYVSSWTDRHAGKVLSASGSLRPTFRASRARIGYRSAVEFDGTNLLELGSSLTSTSSGAVIVTGKLVQGLAWGSGDVDYYNPNWHVVQGGRFSGAIRAQALETTTNAMAEWVYNSSSTTTSHWEWSSNGSAWTVRDNNASLSLAVGGVGNTGLWFGGVTGRDNFSVGGIHLHPYNDGPYGGLLTGWISTVVVLSSVPTGPARDDLYRWLRGSSGGWSIGALRFGGGSGWH